MWRKAFLAIVFACLIPDSVVRANSPPRGPTSPEDEAFQWKSAQEAVSQENWKLAIPFLETLTSRYPASDHIREALFQSGIAHMMTGAWDPARAAFQRVLGLANESSSSNPGETARIKAWLARIDMVEGRFEKALARTHEILRIDPKDLEAFLLKAKIFESMRRPAERQEWWLAYQNEIRDHQDGHIPLLVEAGAFAWELKAKSCPLLSTASRPMDEAAIRAQMKEQGLCLEEGLILIRTMFQKTTLGIPRGFGTWIQTWEDDALQRWNKKYQAFWSACLHPPRPSDMPRGRKAIRAFSDFRDRLEQECTALQQRAATSVEGWKTKHPAHIQIQLNRLLENIRKGKVAP